MEEKKRAIDNAHFTELEKDLLDEFILDLKNSPAIIPLHEEDSRQKYDNINGSGASIELLKENLRYVIANGDLDAHQIDKLSELLRGHLCV